MQRAKIRRWLLVVVVVLAAASMFPSLGGSSHRSVPPARHLVRARDLADSRYAERLTVARPQRPVNGQSRLFNLLHKTHQTTDGPGRGVQRRVVQECTKRPIERVGSPVGR
jgi:hypothetical protein